MCKRPHHKISAQLESDCSPVTVSDENQMTEEHQRPNQSFVPHR